MSTMPRGAVGRADLLRVLAADERHGQPGLALAELGALFGYELETRVADRTSGVGRVEQVVGQASTDLSVPKAVEGGIPFWQPRELVWRDDSARGRVTPETSERPGVDVDADVDASERAQMAAIAPPSTPLLSSRRRLVPMLERALVGERPGDEVDVDELVRRMGRGEHSHEIPRLRRHAWPALVVLVDRDFALVPFWADQEQLCRWLVRVVGESALVVRVVDEHGPEARVFDPHGRRVSPLDGSLAGVPVLALTDLGWYRGPAHQRAWLRLGRRLRRAGERIHALVPVPVGRWTEALCRVWRPMPWERPSAEDGAASDPKVGVDRVERLLRMAAYAHRLEPGLLRTLRLALPRDQADVGTEADAWLHEDVAGWFPSATVVRAERAAALRAAISMEDAERARDALHEWHWHRERQPALWHTEVLTLDYVKPGAVSPQARGEAEAFVERLGVRVEAERTAGERPPEGLRGWLEYVKAHAPQQLWDPSRTDPRDGTTERGRVGRGLQRAWRATHGEGEPPPFADPALRPEGEERRTASIRRVELWQVGRRVGPGGGLEGSEGAGSPVGVIAALDERGYVVEAGGASRAVRVDAPVWLEGKPAAGVELRTDRMTLRLGALEKPEWASAVGRDRFGLWAEVKVWQVRFRMRWIAPGRFVMGSPEDEPGRFADEGPQHEVTITRGFWLGETPVTQALWKAVTSESPSHFKGADRPVESVSWEECRERLIAGLNEAIGQDDGSFRLPAEAEWEYACRAGTSTATYAGPIAIKGERDAPILDEIAWYGGNSGVGFEFDDGADSSGWPNKQYPHTRAGTRRVGQKQPNAWGLYDMLGNVYEWCQDCWDLNTPYSSSEPQQDPTGAATGGSRVVRGGSWVALAWHVRAAYRCGDHPGARGQGLGLRLARDQQPALQTGGLESVGPEDPRGPEGPGRGRGGIGADERGAPGPDVARPRRRSVR